MALTINDIAKKAGVSKRTVSRVLNNSPYVNANTREKIKSIIEEENYTVNVFAQNLRKGKSFNLIGLITNINNLFSKYYFTSIIQSIENYLENQGHTLFIINLLDTDNANIQRKIELLSNFYYSKLIKGFIVLAPAMDDKRVECLSRNNVKGVIIGSKSKSKNFGYVDVNNTDGVKKIIKHIIDKGHRDIAIINGPADLSSAIERRDAFYKIMSRYNFSIPEEYIVDGGYIREGGRAAAEKLFSLNKPPTAIFAANDDMAMGVYDAAKLFGLNIPRDIAVAGFDNIAEADAVAPSLTTIGQPFELMAEIAAQCLIKNNFNVAIELPATLIIRGSV